MLTKRTHDEVLVELRRCDFIIDEAYSDTPMSVTAAEAASFGKPTVVGGYYAADIRASIPDDLMPPSLFCHPDMIESAIDSLILDPVGRVALGARARCFVEARWSAVEVSRRYMAMIRGDVPPDWYCNPQDISYVHGCGVSAPQLRETLRRFLDAGGPRAFCLEDKPVLKARLLRMASEGSL